MESSSTTDSMAHHDEAPSFWQSAKSFFLPSPMTHQNVAKNHLKTAKTDETRRASLPPVDKMYLYSFGSINMP